ncbi:hypothetical protein Tco_0741249 [Tanacetum coccineum]
MQESKDTITSSDTVALKEFDQITTLFNTITKSNSFNKIPKHIALYHALMESILEDEDAMDKGEDLVNTYEQPNDEIVPKNDWYKKSSSDTSPDPEWNKGKLVYDGLEQSWLNDMAATKPPLTFDQLMHTPIDFSAFLNYTMEECYRALSEQLDWNNPEGHRFPYDLTKPLPVYALWKFSAIEPNFRISMVITRQNGGPKHDVIVDKRILECYSVSSEPSGTGMVTWRKLLLKEQINNYILLRKVISRDRIFEDMLFLVIQNKLNNDRRNVRGSFGIELTYVCQKTVYSSKVLRPLVGGGAFLKRKPIEESENQKKTLRTLLLPNTWNMKHRMKRQNFHPTKCEEYGLQTVLCSKSVAMEYPYYSDNSKIDLYYVLPPLLPCFQPTQTHTNYGHEYTIRFLRRLCILKSAIRAEPTEPLIVWFLNRNDKYRRIHTKKKILENVRKLRHYPKGLTNKLQGVSFIADDDVLEGDILSKFLPCQLPPKELNPGSFTLSCTIGS